MADLTVATANCHNERAAVDALPKVDVLLLSEVHRRSRDLIAKRGYTYLTGYATSPSREVGILVSKRAKRLRIRGYWHEFLSAALPRYKSVGKERWGHVALVQLADGTRVACIALHPVAGPQALAGNDPGHRLVMAYASAMRWLEQTIAYHRKRGHEVVVGADIQMREGTERPWSPHPIFRENDMTWLWDGIDVLAWTSGLEPERRPVVNRGFPSDHPLIRANLNSRRNRKKK